MLFGKVSKSNFAVEFIKPGSPEAERPKFLPSQIVTKAQAAGRPAFNTFNIYGHTLLAKQVDARKPAKGYGVMGAETWSGRALVEKMLERLEEG